MLPQVSLIQKIGSLCEQDERTRHWPTPSRGLEYEISSAAYARFAGCIGSLEAASLCRAYARTWEWGTEMAEVLHRRHSLTVPRRLLDAVSERVARVAGRV